MSALPLSQQLSAAHVAFTIEADTLAEQRISHHTADHGRHVIEGRKTVWLASLAMYFTCLRWLPPEGLTIAELRRRARTATNVDGMRRWGYVTIDGSSQRARPGKYPDEAVIAPGRRGAGATRVYERVIAGTEERWRERFGSETVDALRAALLAIVAEIELELPDCLPILGFGMRSLRRDGPSLEDWPRRSAEDRAGDAEQPLVVLLARVLMWITISYELEARLALALIEDVIVPLGPDPVALRELPDRCGVYRPGIDMAMTYLGELECAALEPIPGASRGKQAHLTERGRRALKAGPVRLRRVHEQLADRFGSAVVTTLSECLDSLVGDATRDGSPLYEGLVAPPGTWRSEAHQLPRLPRFPLTLHRGGFPDGA